MAAHDQRPGKESALRVGPLVALLDPQREAVMNFSSPANVAVELYRIGAPSRPDKSQQQKQQQQQVQLALSSESCDLCTKSQVAAVVLLARLAADTNNKLGTYNTKSNRRAATAATNIWLAESEDR